MEISKSMDRTQSFERWLLTLVVGLTWLPASELAFVQAQDSRPAASLAIPRNGTTSVPNGSSIERAQTPDGPILPGVDTRTRSTGTTTVSTATSAATSSRRDSSTTLPPSYSSRKNKVFPEISAAWQKVVSGDLFGSSNKSAPTRQTQVSTSAKTTPGQTTSHTSTSHHQSAINTPVPQLSGPLQEPAFRWYGYGNPLPGLNPYAPTGFYPSVGANWYLATGATPGAFPPPVVNPFRPAPGNVPPVYFERRIEPMPLPKPTIPQGSENNLPDLKKTEGRPEVLQPDRRLVPTPEPPLAEPVEPQESVPTQSRDPWKAARFGELGGPQLPLKGTLPPDDPLMPARHSAPAAGFSGTIRPAGSTTVPELPGPQLDLPGGVPLPRAEAPISCAPQPTLARGQLDDGKKTAKTSVMNSVYSACDSRVQTLEVYQTGPNQLFVRLHLRKMEDARAVVEKISRVPELKEWEIRFEAGIR